MATVKTLSAKSGPRLSDTLARPPIKADEGRCLGTSKTARDNHKRKLVDEALHLPHGGSA